MPDINENSVLLFAYWDKDTDYRLPTIELQTFDSQGKIINKMIVADSINYECSWIRSFEILKDYVLKITDEHVCWDVETDQKILGNKQSFNFHIDNEGKILDEKLVLDISKWNGTYSLVLNANSEDSRDQKESELNITKENIIYAEMVISFIINIFSMFLRKDGVLFLKYRNTIEGGSAVLDKEKTLEP